MFRKICIFLFLVLLFNVSGCIKIVHSSGQYPIASAVANSQISGERLVLTPELITKYFELVETGCVKMPNTNEVTSFDAFEDPDYKGNSLLPDSEIAFRYNRNIELRLKDKYKNVMLKNVEVTFKTIDDRKEYYYGDTYFNGTNAEFWNRRIFDNGVAVRSWYRSLNHCCFDDFEANKCLKSNGVLWMGVFVWHSYNEQIQFQTNAKNKKFFEFLSNDTVIVPFTVEDIESVDGYIYLND